MKIVRIHQPEDLSEALNVIRKSFMTVADDFGITKENAATNPAFATEEQFQEYMKKDLTLYGMIKNSTVIGCIVVEKAADRDDCYYIERLAVLPEERHKGYGQSLLDFAVRTVVQSGGKRIEIGIINRHEVLKKWYLDNGFTITGTKKYDHLPFEVCFMAMDL